MIAITRAAAATEAGAKRPKADSEVARRVKRAAHKWQARCLAYRAARERNVRADERRLVREQRRWRKVRAWWALGPTRDVPGTGREPRSGCTAQPSAGDGAQRPAQRGTWRGGGGMVSFVTGKRYTAQSPRSDYRWTFIPRTPDHDLRKDARHSEAKLTNTCNRYILSFNFGSGAVPERIYVT